MPQNLARLPTSRWRTLSLSHHPRSKGGGHPHRPQESGLVEVRQRDTYVPSANSLLVRGNGL